MRALAPVLLAALPALAHEFWIEPSNFRPARGDLLQVRLMVGDGFPGEPLARNPSRIRGFVAATADRSVDIAGVAGADPAGILRVGEAAPRLLGYHGAHARIELEAEKFEAYLREVGLERIVALRRERGESKKKGREAYARCAKAVLGGPGGGHDRALGYPLELIPETDPAGSRDIVLRLRLDGGPAEGVLVRAFPKDGKSEPIGARTDREGRVSFALPRGGMWMLSGVHMREADKALDADWESLWASLTFESPSAPANK